MSTSDHHHAATGGLPIDGGHPPLAAGLPIDGGPACASAHGDTLPPREDSGDAAPPIVDADLIPAPSHEGGSSPAEPDMTPAASPHGPAGAGPGASAGAGSATEAGPGHLMSPAPPLASPGADPGAELAAPSPALEQPLRGSPTPRPATGASTDTGHALASPSPRNKRGASRPPPSADRRADDDSAVATGAGALPSSADGTDVTLQVTLPSRQPPARRSRCLLLSRLRPLTPRAYNNRHRTNRFRWHSELLQALNRRPKSPCPTQRASPFHSLDLGARAIPPRTQGAGAFHETSRIQTT